MKARPGKRILIIGAGVAGQLLKKDIERNYSERTVVGFVDDRAKNKEVVLGSVGDLVGICDKNKVEEIIIAIPSAEGGEIRRILLSSLDNRIPIRMVPRREIVLKDEVVKYGDVKTVEPEDFLGRKPLKKKISFLSNYYQKKTVMVTGGAGSIGSEIVRQLLDLDVKKVIAYDRSEHLCFELIQELDELKVSKKRYEVVIGDILNKNKLNYVMGRFKPDLAIHAAAYKHVFLMESNPEEAARVNVLGTRNVVEAASENKVARFVQISTDKVVNPESVMGATKKLAECYIRFKQNEHKQKIDFSVVRFGNVVNSQGSVLPLFQRQIRDHGYVTVTDKRMKRFFMSIREAAQLVLMSATEKGTGSVYVLNMGDLISMYDVARCLIRSKNLIPDADVAVRFIGKRKGEKMVEQLFTSAERRVLKKTGLENVWKIEDCGQCTVDIKEAISRIEEWLERRQARAGISRFLKDLYPSLKK